MKGHVYRRGEGSWTFVCDIGRDPSTGKRRQKSRGGFPTKKAAETALRDVLHAQDVGHGTQPTSATVREYLEQWLVNAEPSIRRTTFAGYRRDVARVVKVLGHHRLHDLTPLQIEAAWADMLRHGGEGGRALSAKTVYNAHSTFRRALNDAVRVGVLLRNPVSRARPPTRQKPDMQTWSASELGQFLRGVADDPLFAAYVLVATTGMRRGEALGLRWQDLDLDACFLRIRQTLTAVDYQLVFDTTKTNKSRRRVSLDASTVEVLRAHRERQEAARALMGEAWHSSDLVFTRADGSPVHPDRWTREFQSRVKRLGLPTLKGPHALRHTWATLALEGGIHPKVVSERLGHSTIAITLDTYSHVVEGMDAAAATAIADQIFAE